MTSEIRANTLKNRVGLGTVSFTGSGPVVSGIVTATTFVGALTGNVTGTASGNPTLANGANNRIVTATGANALTGESGLTWTGNYFETSGGAETWTMRARSGGPSSKIGFQNQYLANGYIVGCGADNNSFVVYTDGQNNGERLRIDQVGISTFYQNLFASKDFDVDGHTNLDNVSVAGVSTFSNNVKFVGTTSGRDLNWNYGSNKLNLADNVLLGLGNSDDLLIHHTGSTGYIKGQNGNLYIQSDQVVVIGNQSASTVGFKFTNGGAAELFHNNNLRVQTDTSSTVFRGGGGIRVYGDAGSNQNGQISIHPTGSAVYSNLFFYNAAGNSYASIIGHAGGTLFFTGGTNGPLRHRVNGTGFHSFQEGNTQRVTITAGGSVNIGADFTQTTYKLKVTGTSYLNGDLDVDGHTNLDNVNIAGVTTSTGNIYADNYFANSGLTLNNNGNPSVNITSTSTTGSSRINFGDPDSNSVGYIHYVHDGDYLKFNTAYNERLRIASDGVITAQKSATFGNTSDSFTSVNITSSTSGISELRFADTTANAGYVKYEHSTNNLIFASNATPRMTIQSTGIVKVESNDSSGLSAHLVVNNSESNSGLSIMGSGSSFSSGGWAAVTDAGIIRSSANSSNGLVLQAASGNLRFYAGGNPPAERFRIASDGTPAFFSPAVAWHEGPAVLEASNGYGSIFFRSTGSTHGTSITGTWSVGKMAGTDGFAILKHGMTGGGAFRQDAPLAVSNAGDITIGKNLSIPQKPGFFAYMDGGNQTTNANSVIPFNQTHFNTGGHFKTSGTNAYKFVCPVAGIYHFSGAMWMKNDANMGHARYRLMRNNAVQLQAGWHQANTNMFYDHSAPFAISIYCNASDTVYLYADYQIMYWRGGGSHPHSYFSGHFVG